MSKLAIREDEPSFEYTSLAFNHELSLMLIVFGITFLNYLFDKLSICIIHWIRSYSEYININKTKARLNMFRGMASQESLRVRKAGLYLDLGID